MTRRMNFRISDELAEQVESIVNQLNASGVHVSISEIARKLIEEGLNRVQEKNPRSSTEKGSQFERHVAAELKAALWDSSVEILKKKVGRRTPDIRTNLFDIECKAGKRPSTRDAFAQVKASAGQGQTPIAIIKDDNAAPFVVMEFQTFLALARVVHDLQIFAMDLPRRLKDVE